MYGTCWQTINQIIMNTSTILLLKLLFLLQIPHLNESNCPFSLAAIGIAFKRIEALDDDLIHNNNDAHM